MSESNKRKWPPPPNEWFEGIPAEPVEMLTDAERTLLFDKIERFRNDLHNFRCNQPEWWELNMKTYSPTQIQYDIEQSLVKLQNNCKEILKGPPTKVSSMVEKFQILAGIK